MKGESERRGICISTLALVSAASQLCSCLRVCLYYFVPMYYHLRFGQIENRVRMVVWSPRRSSAHNTEPVPVSEKETARSAPTSVVFLAASYPKRCQRWIKRTSIPGYQFRFWSCETRNMNTWHCTAWLRTRSRHLTLIGESFGVDIQATHLVALPCFVQAASFALETPSKLLDNYLAFFYDVTSAVRAYLAGRF